MNKTHSCSPSWTLETGRGWKGSLLKGKVLVQVTQNSVEVWMAHSFSGALFQCLTTLMGKIFFHRANENFLFSSWWPIASHPVWQQPGSVFPHPLSPEVVTANSKILPLHPSLPAPILSVCSATTQFFDCYPTATKHWPLLGAEVMGAAQSCDLPPLTHLN